MVADRLCSDSPIDRVIVVDLPGPGIAALRTKVAGLFYFSAMAETAIWPCDSGPSAWSLPLSRLERSSDVSSASQSLCSRGSAPWSRIFFIACTAALMPFSSSKRCLDSPFTWKLYCPPSDGALNQSTFIRANLWSMVTEKLRFVKIETLRSKAAP